MERSSSIKKSGSIIDKNAGKQASTNHVTCLKHVVFCLMFIHDANLGQAYFGSQFRPNNI